MSMIPKPLIVQSDNTLLLEVNHPQYSEMRDHLLSFTELEKSPEFIHTYRITPLSLWNAASSGLRAEQINAFLEKYSRYPLPQTITFFISDMMSRYGMLTLERLPERRKPGKNLQTTEFLQLRCTEEWLAEEVGSHKAVQRFLHERTSKLTFKVQSFFRGRLKQSLIKIGYPVEDIAGYVQGSPLKLALRRKTLEGKPFKLRKYQKEAVDIFYAGGSELGGSGVVVLPCGAGKTIIGIGVLAKIGMFTLVLVTNITAAHQWQAELLDKTDLSSEDVGQYTGERKEIKPITITTYQMVTYRRSKEEDFKHFSLITDHPWGLIIYDEVHLLPAPVFRVTSEVQARRRLGLTATLIREDGLEGDVFSLIGPKKYDIPWKDLERRGWIAPAQCIEIRCEMTPEMRYEYAVLPIRRKYRLAAENPLKNEIILNLVKKHEGEQILVIGHYLSQLRKIAELLDAPLITGQVAQSERDELYQQFRTGVIPVLVVSKVANFAIDLPDASVAIQVSGTFGSRQEEAQRLGRILRPKEGNKGAYFYSLVTKNSRDQDHATHRQLFLTEQGYRYTILSYNNGTIVGLT